MYQACTAAQAPAAKLGNDCLRDHRRVAANQMLTSPAQWRLQSSRPGPSRFFTTGSDFAPMHFWHFWVVLVDQDYSGVPTPRQAGKVYNTLTRAGQPRGQPRKQHTRPRNKSLARRQTVAAATLAHTTNNPRCRQIQLHGIRGGCPASFPHVLHLYATTATARNWQPQRHHSQQRCCVSRFWSVADQLCSAGLSHLTV